MKYVRRIEREERKCGIVKILPPERWKMPFVTDTEVHSFSITLSCCVVSSMDFILTLRFPSRPQSYRFRARLGGYETVRSKIIHHAYHIMISVPSFFSG